MSNHKYRKIDMNIYEATSGKFVYPFGSKSKIRLKKPKIYSYYKIKYSSYKVNQNARKSTHF